ncbi:hypothetical protein WJX81_003305 [Elliptochloris bilobata]|uniref:Uncharacterized protein n=1 Tax=Elliptochloris bilobata TaxID=381761 RepID=A0AAW1RBG4_9CHLO
MAEGPASCSLPLSLNQCTASTAIPGAGVPPEDGFYLCKLGTAESGCPAASSCKSAFSDRAACLGSAAQEGTTVAYVCQATRLPPTGSSAPPLLPVKDHESGKGGPMVGP